MRYVVLFLLLLGSLPTLAQRPEAGTRRGSTIRGMVLDSATGKPLREASVSLLQARDSAYISAHITDGDGNFPLRNISEGQYRILITYVGYQNISRRFTVDGEQATIDLGALSLQAQAQTLSEVTIVQERAPVTVKQDTLEFNAGSFKTKPNAAVEDLLKKLPGMEVNRDGTIRAQGQTVNRVLVDGKPFFGDDPKVATRNLPADIVDKVQLYDQQSDQAAFSGMDDGNRERTINITTKRDKRKGYFGRNSAGVGTDGRYTGNLSLNRFNNGRQISLLGMANNINQQGFSADGGGMGFGSVGMQGGPGGPGGPGGGGFVIRGGGGGASAFGGNQQPDNITESRAAGLNFRDAIGKKAEVTASYFVNQTTVTTDQQSWRENILPGQSFLNDLANSSQNRNRNHRLNLRLEWKLDSLTSLRFIPNVQWNNLNNRSLSTQYTRTGAGLPLNQNETDYRMTGDGLTGFSNLLLMRKFRRDGRTFSVNLMSFLNDLANRGINRATNTFFSPDAAIPRANRLNQENRQDNYLMNQNLTASFTEPLSFSKKLEFRYGYATNLNRSERTLNDFNETSGQYDRFNAALSNRFASTFNTHRGGLTLQNKRLRYTYALGVDLQRGELRADNRSIDTVLTRQFTNLLPNAVFSYNWTRNRTLRLNYRTRINAPSVSQLQPVADNTNPLNIRLGDPGLKPEYYHNVMLSYNSFSSSNNNSLFAMLSATEVTNRIASATEFSSQGAQTTRPVNANGFHIVNGFLSLGRRIGPYKLNVNWTTNAAFNRGVSFVNNQPNIARNWTLGQGLSINKSFTDKLDFTVAGNLSYQTAEYSLQPQQNTRFFTRMVDVDLFYQLPFRFALTSDLLYLSNTGRSDGFNQNVTLWNLGLTRQFFKNRQGELRLQVFDLLNQNRSIRRNVTETYVEDVRSQVLRRYVMVSFLYNLRKFGV